jgi:thymidylate kinase
LNPPTTIRAIVFFGADGTGKTTQARLLTKELGKRGFRVKRAWIRGRHTLAFLISHFLLKLGYRGYIIAGIRVLDSRTLPGKKLWSMIEFASVVPLIIMRVYLPLLLGRTIIAERFVIDTIVYNDYYIGAPFKIYERILFRMIPSGSILVHFDASENDLMIRRPEGVVSKQFMKYQLERYRLIASRLQALSINTSEQGIDEANKRIMEEIFERQ